MQHLQYIRLLGLGASSLGSSGMIYIKLRRSISMKKRRLKASVIVTITNQ